MELNLNTVQRPTFKLTMMDDEQTVLRVKMPSKAMFKELAESDATVSGAEKGDKDSAEDMYVLVARLLSHNLDFITVTPEELESKYRMELEDVILTYRAYVDFVLSFVKAKN